tara:strand:+ start:154 stop:348 length:195 start_codon:yes stop_codon:yes gene_type:complete
MPFKSEAQRKWMYANKAKMAKKWEKHTPKNKKLPKKVSESLVAKINRLLTVKNLLPESDDDNPQ